MTRRLALCSFLFALCSAAAFAQSAQPLFDQLTKLRDTAITSPTNGQALVFESATGKWKNGTVSGGGGGAVSSVFGRTGDVISQTGDYTAAQVTNAVDSTASYFNPAWITSLIWSKITSTPTTLGGYGITDAQPLDSDLTAIAALSTTSFGRGSLELANAGAFRTYIGAGTSNFDGTFGSLTGTPTTLAGYGITDAQPLDGDLTALAALTGTNTIYYRSAANTWSSVTIGSGLDFTTGTLSATAGGGGTVTDFSAGNLSPLFTTNVATSTTTPALSFALSNAGARTVLSNNTGSSAAPAYVSNPAFDKIANLTSNGFVKTSGGDGTLSIDTSTYLTGNQTITLSNDVTGSGATSISATIANDAVSFAKMQNIPTSTLIGRTTASAGDPENITIGGGLVMSGGTLGRAALTGEVTAAVDSNSTTIANNAVTYAKMQDVSAGSRILGRNSGAGDPEELTLSQALDFIGSAAQGDVLYRGASTWTRLAAGTDGQILTTHGSSANPTWETAAGGGNVSNSGTPTSGQAAEWTDATHIQGVNTTGSGNYVKATSPTITTPTIAKLANLTTNGVIQTINNDGTLDVTALTSGSGHLTFSGSDAGSIDLTIINSNSGSAASAALSLGNGTSSASIKKGSTTFSLGPNDLVFNPGAEGRISFDWLGSPIRTFTSSASLTLDDLVVPQDTVSVTGTTNVTTATGFNKIAFYRPTYTDSSSVTVSRGATLWIENAPLPSGSLALTNPYALWIDDGISRFDGGIKFAEAAPASGRFAQSDASTFNESSFNLPTSAGTAGALWISDGTNVLADTTPTLVDVLTLATGTTSIAPVNIPAGTVKTTPADGDLEEDANAIYGTTDAGNRGYIPLRHIIRADSTVTYTSSTSLQNIFTTPTNGRLTLETGTYRFHGLISLENMSGTAGNIAINISGGGSATIGTWLWFASGRDANDASTGGAVGGSWMKSNTSTGSIITAGTATEMAVQIDGTFEVTSAGTIQPQLSLVTAAAATLTPGSFIEFWRVGSTSMTSVGQWD